MPEVQEIVNINIFFFYEKAYNWGFHILSEKKHNGGYRGRGRSVVIFHPLVVNSSTDKKRSTSEKKEEEIGPNIANPACIYKHTISI